MYSALSFITSTHYNVFTAIQPIASRYFVPFTLVETSVQFLKFQFFNILSYLHLVLIYNCNLLYVLKETESDIVTFKTSYDQKKFKNKMRLRDNSRSVSVNKRHVFDVIEHWWEFSELWSKSLSRSEYIYDKWVIHFPMSIFDGDLWNSNYRWDPQNYPVFEGGNPSSEQQNNSDSEEEFPYELGEERNQEKFVPKSYLILEGLKSKGPKQIIVKKPQDTGVSPVLPYLLSDSLNVGSDKENTLAKKNVAEPREHHLIETSKAPISATNSKTVTNNVSYKIKIRKNKTKDIKNHPTYGNYDLIAQAIKNVLPQANYRPDGNIGPNIVRFTWHCCAHYDKYTGTGGSSGGTMRFAQEFNDTGNTGLNTAKSYLDQIQQEFPWVSFADLYTYAGCIAIQAMGGPNINWKPGRTDCPDASKVPPVGRLPNATKNYSHIKEVFYNRLGFNAQETVALIGGGHGIGSCHAKFSGFDGVWTNDPFKWDNEFFKMLLEEEWKTGIVPQTGIEQYYNEDKSLMMLNTDLELLRCPEFRSWVEIYARDLDLFNQCFADAFAKLLELGVIRDADGIQRVKI